MVHGGFVTVDAHSLRPARIIPFQYNPETLSRTLSPGASSSASSAPISETLASNPKLPSADREALKARLEAKIATLRALRKADGPDGRPARSRQELIEALFGHATVLAAD